MSRKNNLQSKQRRRVERAEQAERTAYLYEVSQEQPVIQDAPIRLKNRKERRHAR
jgi:hypothetical protein